MEKRVINLTIQKIVIRMSRIIISIFCIALMGHFVKAQETEVIPLSYSYSQYYTIGGIDVVGAYNIDQQEILGVSGLKVGDKIAIPGESITSALKKIWKQNLVGDVKILASKVEDKTIFLTIVLKEHERLTSYGFDGISKSQAKDLRDILALSRGRIVTNALIKNSKINIERFFEEEGYYNVSVKEKRTSDTLMDNHVLLEFLIKRDEKVKVNEIVFTGNIEIPSKSLKKQFRNTKEKVAFRILKRSKYIEEEFKEDKSALIGYYNSLGYRDAKVLDYNTTKLDEKTINLNINLYEGRKYYFRNIEWQGNNVYKTALLDSILHIKKGEIYNQSLLDTRLNFNPSGPDVSSLYMDEGYLFFNVNPVEVTVDGDSIDLEIRIYEGNQAIIKNIMIAGNTKTSDHVILREIRTLPGTKFSRSDLINTQRRIAGLGYFDPESIGIVPVPNAVDGTVDINYSVVEKPSDQLQLSGGWGGAVGFVGTLGLTFNNFSLRNITKPKFWDPLPSGDGQRLSLQFQANGPLFQNYAFSFSEPWLGGKRPINLGVSLSHSIQKSLNADRSVSGALKVSRMSLSLGKQLKWPDEYFSLIHTLGYTKYVIDDFQSVLCSNCDAHNLNYTATIGRNDVGINPQFPTRGSSISLSGSFTPPYSLMDRSREDLTGEDRYNLVEYHKWMFDYTRYIQLTGNKKQTQNQFGTSKTKRNLVLATRAHFGYIGKYNPNFEIGPFERYTMGGSGITGFSFLLGTDVIGLRGYNDNSVTPSGNGIAYDKFVMEMRYPIVTQGIATIFVLGFLEGGNNWSSHSEINVFNMYRSYGFGARIFMPAFGMIGIDWGKGLDELPGCVDCNQGQIHFSIGQQIR